MSYEPTNWKAGDVVTSAKLNKMEQGIAASGGIRIVHLTMSGDLPSGDKSTPITKAASKIDSDPVITNPTFQLDITPNELMDAFENEEIVVVMGYNDPHRFQTLIPDFIYDDEISTVTIENFPEFTSSDPDEYFTYNPNSSDDGSGTVIG